MKGNKTIMKLCLLLLAVVLHFGSADAQPKKERAMLKAAMEEGEDFAEITKGGERKGIKKVKFPHKKPGELTFVDGTKMKFRPGDVFAFQFDGAYYEVLRYRPLRSDSISSYGQRMYKGHYDVFRAFPTHTELEITGYETTSDKLLFLVKEDRSILIPFYDRNDPQIIIDRVDSLVAQSPLAKEEIAELNAKFHRKKNKHSIDVNVLENKICAAIVAYNKDFAEGKIKD
jgi:hypothetical protein